MKPLIKLVEEAVLAGAKNMLEVTAMIGNYISAAQAMPAWRRERAYRMNRPGRFRRPADPPIKHQLKIGKQRIISESLPILCRQGKIVRLSRGLYGPPFPKLFISESTKNSA